MSEKQCSACRRTLPTSMFCKNAKAASGLNWHCRDCQRSRDKSRRARLRAANPKPDYGPGRKKCSACGEVLDLSDFYANRTYKDGRVSACKPCMRRREHERYWTPERLAARESFRLKGKEGTVCEYLPCDELQSAAGLCSRHYRDRRIGRLDEALVLKVYSVCSAPGCEQIIADGRLVCRAHERQWKRRREMWPIGRCKDCGESLPSDATLGRIYCDKCRSHRGRAHGRDRLWHERLLAEQGYACAICGTDEPGGRAGWQTDHDHECCPAGRSCGKCVRGLLCYRCNAGLGLFRDDARILIAASDYLSRHSRTSHLEATE